MILLLINKFSKTTVWTDVRIAVQNSEWWYGSNHPDYWYGYKLKKGDVAQNSFGSTVAKISSIENYDLSDRGRNIYVNVSMKLSYNKRKQTYEYEYKPLTVGSAINLNFPQSQIRGIVVGFAPQDFELYDKVITIENKAITPEVANMTQVGDKIYDSNGNQIAEVLEVRNEISRDYEFSDIRGVKILTHDPLLHHLTAKIQVKSYTAFGLNYYIDQTPLKTGQLITLSFPTYKLKDVEIIRIEDKSN